MSSSDFLQTRSFERMEVVLPAEFEICAEDCGQVSIARSAPGQRTDRIMIVTVVDLAVGGIGVHSRTFMPRGLRGTIRFLGDHSSPDADSLFSRRVEVKRVRMVTREPQYLVGLGFHEGENLDAMTIEGLIKRIASSRIGGGE